MVARAWRLRSGKNRTWFSAMSHPAVAGMAALPAVGFGYLGGGLGGGAVAPPSFATQAADLPTMAPASPTARCTAIDSTFEPLEPMAWAQ